MPPATPSLRFQLGILLAMLSLCAETIASARNDGAVVSTATERMGGLFVHLDIVQSTRPAVAAYLRVASLSIALYEWGSFTRRRGTVHPLTLLILAIYPRCLPNFVCTHLSPRYWE